ncbi:OPT/YSL family transporter [Ihubacter sp. rT4E-8]|uniref:OPT/YSL family transporter n=1 Tax=Ihubacter sp. rT4E-8 TaxID=3242369 RepID=UPI003CE780D1
MQSCATATIFAAFSVYDNITAMFMMGEEVSLLPVFVLLILTDAMGICFVSLLRDQYVNDPNLPFPGAVMCTTALEQIDKKDNSSTKILLIATALGFALSMLQNFQIIPMIISVIVGGIAGMFLFYAILKTFGLDDDLFTYPVANMYHSVISGVTEGSASGFFNPMRFGLGAAIGTVLSFIGLPAGGIAIAMYLPPRNVMGLALGGVIRWIIEKKKGEEVAEKYNNAATGIIIGDAIVTISMIGISLASA